MKGNMKAEIEHNLQIFKDRDQVLSQLSSRDHQLSDLHLRLDRVASQMAKLHSHHSTLSEESMSLASKLHAQETSYSEGLWLLIERLKSVSLRQTSTTTALEEYRTLDDEHQRDREQELMCCLAPKAASFFQMGFDGAVQ